MDGEDHISRKEVSWAVEFSPEAPVNFVPSPLFHLHSALQTCLLLSQIQHKSHLRSPGVCTKQYNLVGKNKAAVLNKWAKDSFCMLAPRFISSQQAETHWLRSLPVPNYNFHTSSCFKYSPNKLIFSHLHLSTLHSPHTAPSVCRL